MSGILWAILGTAIGLLVPVLLRVWQRRRGDDPADTPPTAVAPRAAPAPTQIPLQARMSPSGKPAGGLNRRQTRKFHGVSVKPGLHACPAVQALKGRRYLPDEAPAMPLAACDQLKCQCGYAHHGDRRDPGDRRSGWGGFGGFTPSIPGGNRRSKRQERRS